MHGNGSNCGLGEPTSVGFKSWLWSFLTGRGSDSCVCSKCSIKAVGDNLCLGLLSASPWLIHINQLPALLWMSPQKQCREKLLRQGLSKQGEGWQPSGGGGRGRAKELTNPQGQQQFPSPTCSVPASPCALLPDPGSQAWPLSWTSFGPCCTTSNLGGP